MKKYLPLFQIVVFLLTSQFAAKASYRSDEASSSFQDNGLATPYFTSQGFAIYEKTIIWSFINPNEDSETEIYISRSPDSNFELAYVASPGEEVYEDTSRLPRTTYYFRMRAVKDNLVSAFSNIKSFTTGSKFYYPVLGGIAADHQTIELTFHDRSFDDVWYEVWRESGPEASRIWTIVASDSGKFFKFTDSGLQPNTSYSYRVDAHTKGPNSPVYYGVATAVIQTWEEDSLEPPEFEMLYPPDPPYYPPFLPVPQNEIGFDFVNPNADSETEIYISRFPDSDFRLIHVAPVGVTHYFNEALSSLTKFYFKLRAVRDGHFSNFSSVESITTGAKLFPPVLTATAKGPGTVELVLTNQTYYKLSYSIINEGKELHNEWWIPALDSGEVYRIIDDGLHPGTTYTYRVDAEGPNPPSFHEIYYAIATASARTPDGPWIDGITLVDTDTNEDGMFLNEWFNETISVPDNVNLRAEASPDTRSVVFLLNGVKRIENQEPYTYFGDVQGDYKPGKLPDGQYTLEATPYTEKNGAGVQGSTFKIQFNVRSQLVISGFTLVDPYTSQDVMPLHHGDILPVSNWNIRADVDTRIKSVAFSLNGKIRIENREPFACFGDINGNYNPGDLKQGEYILEAIPYSDYNGTGTEGSILKIVFAVTTLGVESFTLVNPITNQDEKTLQNGDVIDSSIKWNIRANTDRNAGSVVFFLNGVKRIENAEPYAYFGDIGGNYNEGRLKNGSFILEATAYSNNNGQGIKGYTSTIEFTVQDVAGTQAMTVGETSDLAVTLYPNPAMGSVFIEISDTPGSNVHIEITDQFGYRKSVLYNGYLDASGFLNDQLQVSALNEGIYILLIRINERITSKRISIKK